MNHVPIPGMNCSRERVEILGLVRLLSFAKPHGLETGGALRNSWCIKTIWGREVRFPAGKRVSKNLTIDVYSVITNTTRIIIFPILQAERD